MRGGICKHALESRKRVSSEGFRISTIRLDWTGRVCVRFVSGLEAVEDRQERGARQVLVMGLGKSDRGMGFHTY